MHETEILTPVQMRRLEQSAFEKGVPSLLLMERAAQGVLKALEKRCCGNVLFMCGSGNNGGDGLAAARLFALAGKKATVLLENEPKTPDAMTNYRYVLALDLPVIRLSAENAESFSLNGFDGIVDAVFGTGFHGVLDGVWKTAAERINASGLSVIAVDVPSGLDATTGEGDGMIRAAETVTFHAPKRGLYLTPHRECVGEITVADIGLGHIPGLAVFPEDESAVTLDRGALEILKNRRLNAHKGDCGRVCVYAGSMGMIGAAAMCAGAAVRAGAGLTTILCDRECMPVLQALVPNAMCRTADDEPPYDVLVLGCGLGQSEEKWRNILRLHDPGKYSVWDADALNMLSVHDYIPGPKAVLTPHAGEAARLLGVSIPEILKDRTASARAIAAKYRCTAVLKSDMTVVAGTEGKIYINTVSTPALAKGGSGDVLAGITGAVLCEYASDPVFAAALACLWHGVSALEGVKTESIRTLTAQQVIGNLGLALRG